MAEVGGSRRRARQAAIPKFLLSWRSVAGYYRIVSLVGLNAVECAVALQCRMADANGALPAERRIELRVGINLGDVVVEGGDLFGDGVNVAARLQEVADPAAGY